MNEFVREGLRRAAQRESVVIDGVSDSAYNGAFVITAVTDTTFSYSLAQPAGTALTDAPVQAQSGLTQTWYDAGGNVVLTVDSFSRATRYAYDPRNLLIAQTDPRGVTPHPQARPPLPQAAHEHPQPNQISYQLGSNDKRRLQNLDGAGGSRDRKST